MVTLQVVILMLLAVAATFQVEPQDVVIGAWVSHVVPLILLAEDLLAHVVGRSSVSGLRAAQVVGRTPSAEVVTVQDVARLPVVENPVTQVVGLLLVTGATIWLVAQEVERTPETSPTI